MVTMDQIKTCAQNIFNKMESGNNNIHPEVFGKELKKAFGVSVTNETITEVTNQITTLQTIAKDNK